MTPDQFKQYLAEAATDYAAEFDIPMDEVREWFRGSDDKPGLVEYMRDQVREAREWRATVAREWRERRAA